MCHLLAILPVEVNIKGTIDMTITVHCAKMKGLSALSSQSCDWMSFDVALTRVETRRSNQLRHSRRAILIRQCTWRTSACFSSCSRVLMESEMRKTNVTGRPSSFLIDNVPRDIDVRILERP
jgi:hypothetical protein